MKKIILFLALTYGFVSCTKTDEPVPAASQATTTTPPAVPTTTAFDTKNQTLVLKGTFMSNAHTVAGTVKVYENSEKKRTMVFENFSTEAGPDLRIWVAEDAAAKNYIEVANKVTNGNFYVAAPATADLSKQPYVLIWCKSFTVLFGNAKLGV
jgi:Electron transfer DM13